MHNRATTHDEFSAHQTVTLLATVAWARVSGQERIQEAAAISDKLSLTNRAMLVCKVVEGRVHIGT